MVSKPTNRPGDKSVWDHQLPLPKLTSAPPSLDEADLLNFPASPMPAHTLWGRSEHGKLACARLVEEHQGGAPWGAESVTVVDAIRKECFGRLEAEEKQYWETLSHSVRRAVLNSW